MVVAWAGGVLSRVRGQLRVGERPGVPVRTVSCTGAEEVGSEALAGLGEQGPEGSREADALSPGTGVRQTTMLTVGSGCWELSLPAVGPKWRGRAVLL